MKFAAIIEYGAKEKILEIRPTHRKYLAELKAAGKLVVAGPFTDFSGGLIVYEAEDEKAAEQLIKDDPFYAGGVFVKWSIRPWMAVMSNHSMLPEAPPPA
jgi:uncharacterized protein YciI